MKRREFSLKKFKEALQIATQKAINENFALDIPISIIENGVLYEVFKDGSKKAIKKV